MARALFLRHHLEDSPGLIGEAFAARGFEVDLAMMASDRDAPSLDGYDALVILGSKCSVYELDGDQEWFRHELALIGDADARGVAVLGICFGAQALCRHFGGVVSRADDEEIGWFEVDVTEGVALPAGPWFEFHFDHCTLPSGAQVWATSPRAVQAFTIGRHVGVQFHPEIDEVQLKEWLASDEDETRALGLDVAGLLRRTAQETPAARARAQQLVDLYLSHH